MANTIKIKRSAVQGKVPAVGDLSLGELALNTYDGKLYTLKNDGANSVVEIGASSGASFSTDISLQNQSATRYYEASANGTNYIAIRAPSALSTDVTLTLPTTDGDADQVLVTDGSGNLSWVSRVGGSGTTEDFLSSSTASEQSGYFGNVYLKDDSNTSHYLEITNSADLTALRTLSINVNDVNRTISLSGNLTVSSVATISGTNTGDQTITLTGDVTGSGTGSFTTTLANSGVTAGTYRSVTVNVKGRVTAGTNPTTLSGYGITDALSNSATSTQAGYFGDIFLYDDSTPSHYLAITNSANLTAARTLSVNVNDANRSVSLSGNLTLANNLTTSGNFALTLTTTAATNVTLPTSGTLAVNNQTMNIGTTAVAINRASASLALTGITSIDGSAVTLTATSGALGLVATGANLVSITTNGTERVRVNSSGNVGINTTNPGYNLEVAGSFAATTKSFVIDHPTKEGYKLRYGSLEGPENGIYVRGQSKDFVIELPDYWTKLIDPDSITVNLTPIGKTQTLWVKGIRDNKIYIGSKCSEINYFYMVLAERADVDKLEVEIPPN